MAQFKVSHAKTMGVEGASNWNPHDKGNVVVHGVCVTPTFSGIAPAFHGTWKGFALIRDVVAGMRAKPAYDTPAFWAWKKELDKKLAASLALQSLVASFYQANFWDTFNLSQIASQEVADWIYDHVVNGSARGAKWAQLAAGVTPDGGIGPVTIAAINAMPPAKFLSRAEDIAGQYRLDVASKDPSQIQFLESWLRRDGQPEKIISMVKAAAKDGCLDTAEVTRLGDAMESTA